MPIGSPRGVWVALLVPVLLSVPSRLAAADETRKGRIDTPSAKEVEEKLPAGAALTGRELYDRFLKNRRKLRTAYQNARIISADPGGNPQETRFVLAAKDYRDAEENPVDGIYAKTLVTLSGPYDMRKTGYLYVHRDGQPDDQYMYSPNRRRIARVSLIGQTLAGTDFNFDDFLVSIHDIEDADYKRLPDESIDGAPVYVVEAAMKPSAESTYDRALVYLERQHYVPIRTRYFEDGVEVKELTSPAPKIKEYDGAWVPTESTMRDVREGTHSTLHVDELDPNPDLDDDDFNLSRLLDTRG